MRRVRLLVLALILVATMLVSAGTPTMAQEWIQSNSVPSYVMWCDWWWNPQNVITGKAQWEYWCSTTDGSISVRER